jgi:dihydrofolate synthase/folylpolyglutamate synthase
MPTADLAALAADVLGPDRVTVAERLDDAIELGVTLADEADASGEGGPGKAGVLITGSVVTAGDARALLTDAAGNGVGWTDSRDDDPGAEGDAR